ncbi:MAG: hypothetical protein Q4C25_05525, partial [Bacillota bacterium]|nr:hypothetical protein [Bacillota bacterium]
ERNIVIIEGCDTMTLRAQNRLLKTLEEPPGNAVLILLSENMEHLTQTIQSRCVKYRLHDTEASGDGEMMDKAEKIADMILERASFYRLKKETDEITGDSRKLEAFLDSLQVVYRNKLLKKDEEISLYKDGKLMENIHAVEETRRRIDAGVSPAYAIKDLLLKIGG